MPTATENLAILQLSLPRSPAPVASYVPAVRSGSLLYISGQLPTQDGALLATGAVPSQVDLETATRCARQCTLNGLAHAARELGSLDKVARVVRVGCFVASGPNFDAHPKVANGASELLLAVFGDAGRHARAAVGCSSLPLDAPVEIEFLFEVS